MLETYSYTGTMVATEVKTQFGDTGNVQINDTLLLQWINNGIREIVSTNPFLEAILETNLLAGQSVYDLVALAAPKRMQSYSSVVANGRKIDILKWPAFQLKIGNQDALADTSEIPLIGSEYAGRLSLWPVPSVSLVKGLVVYYVAYPDDLAALTQNLTVPDRFRNVLVAYVLAKAMEMDENFDAARDQLKQHTEGLQKELQRGSQNPTDFYPEMSDVTEPGDTDPASTMRAIFLTAGGYGTGGYGA